MAQIEKGISEGTQVAQYERLKTPEEELAYLRERVRLKEAELGTDKTPFEQARLAKREIVHYQDTPTPEVLHTTYTVPEETLLHETLRLEPEEHDIQVDELLKMIPKRGIKNTLAVVAKMGSAHLEDDIHRALVQYVAEGLPTKDIKKGSETWKALHMTLFEVSLSTQSTDEHSGPTQELGKLLASMEQFYAGLLSVVGDGTLRQKNIFSVEIAVQQGSEEAVFYVGVPSARKELFIKHIISIFPHAHVDEMRGDYNIFQYGGVHMGAYGTLQKSPAYPLKGYEEFVHDPLNIVLSAFSKLKKHGEGAAIQFIIGDEGGIYNKQYKNVLDHLRSGKKAGKAVRYGTKPFSEALDAFKEGVGDAVFNKTKKPDKERVVDELALEMVGKKAGSRIVPTNIRILASTEDIERSEEIVDTIISTFNQFEEAQGNKLIFKKEKNATLRSFLHQFTFRTLNMSRIIPLSLTELTAMYHLSGEGISTSRELKQSRAKQVAAPIAVSASSDAPEKRTNTVNEQQTPKVATHTQVNSNPLQESVPVSPPATVSNPIMESAPSSAPPVQNQSRGVILGENSFGGSVTQVMFLPEDRMRHFYEIGQTGTGKTNLMKNMIIQDIQNGEGCCYIDPHGSDIVDVLASIPPERYNDVIYFDPAYSARPMGLNIMEFNPEFPEQKTFVVNEIFSIFEKLFLAKSPESLGPMFEQYFRNAAMLVLEGMPVGTATIADIPRVLADASFRHECLANSKNNVINLFWEEIAEKAEGDAALQSIVPYITAKTDIFLSNEIIRPIISQEKSAFNFREIMDSKKIFLVNLSKGRLGDLNAELLGLIIVGKFLQGALSRVDIVSRGEKPSDFYLYIDEFQNFTTPSIATILSEARKYRLSLNVAHQFISQLEDNIKNAVFGNVGTKCVFRVSSEDAEFLEKQFQPEFGVRDIVGLDNYNAYVAMLVNGKPIQPFNMYTLPPLQVDFEKVETIKKLSYELYGRSRDEVEAEISKKYARSSSLSLEE